MSVFSTAPWYPCHLRTGPFSYLENQILTFLMAFLYKLEEPVRSQLEKGLCELSLLAAWWEPLLTSQGTAHRVPVRAVPCCTGCLAFLTEKGDRHAIPQNSELSFLLLLSQVWCIKPRKTLGRVEKAGWCNSMKITGLGEKLPAVKSVPSAGTATARSVFVLHVVILQAEKLYVNENFQCNWTEAF